MRPHDSDRDGAFDEDPPEDLDGYLEVKNNSAILIAGGECEYTRFVQLPRSDKVVSIREADV